MTDLERLTEEAKSAAQAVLTGDIDSRERYRLYGAAILAIRQQPAMKSDKVFNAYLVEHNLALKRPSFRSDAMWLASVWGRLQNAVNECPSSHPSDIRSWCRQHYPEIAQFGLKRPRRPKQPKDDKRPANWTDQGKRPAEDAARAAIRAKIAAGDPNPNLDDIAKETGISHGMVVQAAAIERAVRKEVEQVHEELTSLADDPTLSLNKRQQRLYDRMVRDLEKKRADTEAYIEAEAIRRNREHVELTYLPAEKKRIAEMERALREQFKPPFTNAEFRSLLAALHPDSTPERRVEVFRMVTERTLKLRGVDPGETTLADALPTTIAELHARRRARA